MDLLNTSFPIGSDEWLRQVAEAIQELYDGQQYMSTDLGSFKSQTAGDISSLDAQVLTLVEQVDGLLNP